MAEDLRMVKMPLMEYEQLRQAQNTLLQRGYQGLPPEVVRDRNIQSFNNGAVVGLALAALLYLLTKEGK